MKQARRVRSVFVAALAVLTAVGLLSECTFRVVRFGAAGLSYAKVNSVHDIGHSGLIEPSPYPEVIYQLKPNLRTYFKLAELRTNAEGLPDDEYPVTKPPGTFRIAVAGSSFSMASGVALADSWHGLLERHLNDGSKGTRYEVINFSVGGYDLRQLRATIESRIVPYSPDLILVELTRRSPVVIYPGRVYRTPYQPHPRTFPFFHSFALDVLWPPPLARDNEPLPPAEAKREFERLLAELDDFGRQKHLRLCLVILEHQPWDAVNDPQMRDIARRSGIPMIDTAEGFTAKPFSHWILFDGDPHPNARAHAVFERLIMDGLRRGGFLQAAS